MSGTEAHEHAPFIDYENLPAPTEGIVVTQRGVVRAAEIAVCSKPAIGESQGRNRW